MTEILINSYNRNSGSYQDFTVQLNTPLSTTKPTKLRLKYFRMVNGVYNMNGGNVFIMIETELDTSTSTTTQKQYNVAIPAGSYTATDFASAAQTAIINASAANGYSWNYTVAYNSSTTQMTYTLTTSAPSGYIYSAYINSVINYKIQYLTGVPVYFYPNNGVLLPASFIPNLSNYTLLMTINNNTHNHISTNVKKFTFAIPISTSDNNIIYTNNTNFDNSIIIAPQSFNNITISMTCLEFAPIINNDCTILLELEN